MPQLAFSVRSVAAEPFAATPTLRFTLGVESRNGVPIRSAMLNAQVRIAAAQRSYGPEEQARLMELFGSPSRWGETLRSLYWTHATFIVQPFEGETTADVLVPCTYDFDVMTAKYLYGVQEGEIPLELFFTGSVFYSDTEGLLKTTRVSWESEAVYRLPVQVWKDMMNHYFPQSAWIRLRQHSFDRLYAFKASRGLSSWEAALEMLLEASATTADT